MGAFQTYANANLATRTTNFNTLDANIGLFQTYANTKIGTNSGSNLVVVATTTSSSTTTGALVVAGGVGIGGNVVATGVVGTHYGAGTGLTGTASALTVGVAGVVTGVTSANVTTALGFTPISASSNASTQVSSLGVGTAASGLGGEIRAINNITAYYSSDERFKENIRPIPDALQKVVHIGGKLYDWTDKYIAEHGGEDGYFVRKSDFGVVAQHLLAAGFSEGVRTRPDGSLAVDYEKLSALAFQAIADLYEEVQQLKAR